MWPPPFWICGGRSSLPRVREELAIQVEQQRLANQELRDAIENSDDPDTLERVAREKGYVKQGETLYIDVAG
ncbi:MAG: septum formation initiator family protein [Lawsonibacter sp.]